MRSLNTKSLFIYGLRSVYAPAVAKSRFAAILSIGSSVNLWLQCFATKICLKAYLKFVKIALFDVKIEPMNITSNQIVQICADDDSALSSSVYLYCDFLITSHEVKMYHFNPATMVVL